MMERTIILVLFALLCSFEKGLLTEEVKEEGQEKELEEEGEEAGETNKCLDIGLFGITCESLDEQYLKEHGKSLCEINPPLAIRCCIYCGNYDEEESVKDEL